MSQLTSNVDCEQVVFNDSEHASTSGCDCDSFCLLYRGVSIPAKFDAVWSTAFLVAVQFDSASAFHARIITDMITRLQRSYVNIYDTHSSPWIIDALQSYLDGVILRTKYLYDEVCAEYQRIVQAGVTADFKYLPCITTMIRRTSTGTYRPVIGVEVNRWFYVVYNPGSKLQFVVAPNDSANALYSTDTVVKFYECIRIMSIIINSTTFSVLDALFPESVKSDVRPLTSLVSDDFVFRRTMVYPSFLRIIQGVAMTQKTTALLSIITSSAPECTVVVIIPSTTKMSVYLSAVQRSNARVYVMTDDQYILDPIECDVFLVDDAHDVQYTKVITLASISKAPVTRIYYDKRLTNDIEWKNVRPDRIIRTTYLPRDVIRYLFRGTDNFIPKSEIQKSVRIMPYDRLAPSILQGIVYAANDKTLRELEYYDVRSISEIKRSDRIQIVNLVEDACYSDQQIYRIFTKHRIEMVYYTVDMNDGVCRPVHV